VDPGLIRGSSDAKGCRSSFSEHVPVTPLLIRLATSADIGIIAHHRASMFRDMGSVSAALVDEMQRETRAVLPGMFERGEYVGWLAAPASDPARIVSGVGVQRRRVQPFPLRRADGAVRITQGRQALVVNVFTEAEFRRQGAARQLMLAMMTWASTAGVDAVVLHAAPDGRALYESLGFVQTNEMRFPGDIAEWRVPIA
jgi:GNAT superfamily N-acetyltransferase